MVFEGDWAALFFAGATGIWKGIGLGLFLTSSPFEIGTFTAAGSIFSVLILFFSGDKIHNWLLNRIDKKRLDRKKGKFQIWFQKYGSFGLGVLATGPFGPFVPLLVGLLFIDKKRKLLIYIIIGIIIWSYVLAYFSKTLADFTRTLF